MSSSKKSRKSNGSEKPSKSKRNEPVDDSDNETDDFDAQTNWDCTVCTFKNRFEAFKCEICYTRKGTSTRKPRLNQNVVQQQVLVQNLALREDKAQRRLRQRDETPDNSPQPLSVNAKRETSIDAASDQTTSPASIASSNGVPRVRKEKEREKEKEKMEVVEEAEVDEHKKDRIQECFIQRDLTRDYFVEVNGVSVTITAYKNRNADKELQLVNALRAYEEGLEPIIKQAREEYNAEKSKFEEDRARQRAQRAAHQKEHKSRKPVVKKGANKSSATKKTPVFKVPSAKNGRNRVPNKQVTVPASSSSASSSSSSKKKAPQAGGSNSTSSSASKKR